MSTTLCSHPGCKQAHDNWPGPGPIGELSQDHWEAYCERQWWQACTAIDDAGLMVWYGGRPLQTDPRTDLSHHD